MCYNVLHEAEEGTEEGSRRPRAAAESQRLSPARDPRGNARGHRSRARRRDPRAAAEAHLDPRPARSRRPADPRDGRSPRAEAAEDSSAAADVRNARRRARRPVVSDRSIYLDSSAILKLVYVEDETEALEEFLRGWPRRTSSVLARVEVMRLARRVEDPLVARGAREILERVRSEEHTSELQSRRDLVCRLLLEKKKHQ